MNLVTKRKKGGVLVWMPSFFCLFGYIMEQKFFRLAEKFRKMTNNNNKGSYNNE
jgi:hypothetical protein